MGTITIGRNEYNVEERSMYQQEIFFGQKIHEYILYLEKMEMNIHLSRK